MNGNHAATKRETGESSASTLLWFLRFFGYAAVLAAAFEGVVTLARTHDVHWLMRDDGPVESLQLAAAATAAVLFFRHSLRVERFADLMRCFCALSLIACARELDNFTLEMGSRNGWVYLAAMPLAWAGATVVRARSALVDEARTFARTSSFALLMVGFLVVVVYAQILGQKVLWMSVLDPAIYRPVKDLVEETSELLGYLLLLFGAFEAAFVEKRR